MNTALKSGVLLFAIALITFTFAVAVLSGKLVGTLREVDATAHTTRGTVEAAMRIVDEQQERNGNCWPAGFSAWLGGQKVLLGEAALTERTRPEGGAGLSGEVQRRQEGSLTNYRFLK